MLAKIPTAMQPEIRDGYWAVFDIDDATTEPCPRLLELVGVRLTAFGARYGTTCPVAMKILLTDRQGLTACLRFPAERDHRIRHTNFIERTFGETRCRAKVTARTFTRPIYTGFRTSPEPLFRSAGAFSMEIGQHPCASVSRLSALGTVQQTHDEYSLYRARPGA